MYPVCTVKMKKANPKGQVIQLFQHERECLSLSRAMAVWICQPLPMRKHSVHRLEVIELMATVGQARV